MVPKSGNSVCARLAAFLSRANQKRLYVDNGSAFRSRQLALVCAKLGIALIHAKPYKPQGKGKMERWFRTVRMQYLATLSPENKTRWTR